MAVRFCLLIKWQVIVTSLTKSHNIGSHSYLMNVCPHVYMYMPIHACTCLHVYFAYLAHSTPIRFIRQSTAQAKVTDADLPAILNQHVRGLQVPMSNGWLPPTLVVEKCEAYNKGGGRGGGKGGGKEREEGKGRGKRRGRKGRGRGEGRGRRGEGEGKG